VFDGVFYCAAHNSRLRVEGPKHREIAVAHRQLSIEVFMEDRTDVVSCWRLAGSIGAFAAGEMAGHVDVAHPDRGLSKLQIRGRETPGRLLCMERDDGDADKEPWPLTVKESYVRATDLIATYSAADDWPYSPQIYWSAGAVNSVEGVVGSLSLLVSVQTHLLDAWPRIAVESRLACDETLRVRLQDGEAGTALVAPGDRFASSPETCCVLHRLSDASLSYAEIMLGSDFREAAIAHDAASGESSAKWTLFSEFMEKGVIRRARLVGAFLPRENDVALAARCCEAIERSPLPLTV
jgi:hypothetical protein